MSLHLGLSRALGTKEVAPAFTVPPCRRRPPAAPVSETWPEPRAQGGGAEGRGRRVHGAKNHQASVWAGGAFNAVSCRAGRGDGCGAVATQPSGRRLLVAF